MKSVSTGGRGSPPLRGRFRPSSRRIERSAVAARGRKHQRPRSAASYASMVPMGALVEAGGGYRVKPNVKAKWVITERQ